MLTHNVGSIVTGECYMDLIYQAGGPGDNAQRQTVSLTFGAEFSSLKLQ